MDFLDEELEEIFNIFQQECDELLEKLNSNLLKLENHPNSADIINELFRDAHSVKGAARMIGLNDIQLLAHKAEDIFGLAKENQLQITPAIIDLLCKTVDNISSIIAESVKTRGVFHSPQTDALVQELEKITNAPSAAEAPISQVQIDNIVEKIPQPEPLQEPVESDLNFTNDEADEIKNIFCEEVNTQLPQIQRAFSEIQNNSKNIDKINELYSLIANIYNSTMAFEEDDLKESAENIKQKLSLVIKGSGMLLNNEIIELNESLNNFISIFSKFAKKPDIKPIKIESLPSSLTKDEEISNLPPKKTEKESIAFKASSISEVIESISDTLESATKDDAILNDLIQKTTSVLSGISVGAAQSILEKTKDILEKIKKSTTKPDIELLNIVKESLKIAKNIHENDFSTQEDPSLIIQRLEILKQMLDMTNETTFEIIEPQFKPAVQNTELLDKNATIDTEAHYKPSESSAIKTLRVDTKKLDMLVNQVGELIIAKIKTKEHLNEIDEISNSLEEWYREWNKAKQSLKYIDRQAWGKTSELSPSPQKNLQTFFDESSNKIMGFINNMNTLYRKIQEGDARLNLIVNDLETMVKSVRVLPLATIFHMFPRMVRDIARDKGKEIELVISGSETSADKKVIEEIKSPLIHIIRNAIDHGIETPEMRVQKNKPPAGKIYLSAAHLENSILIEIIDDGNGINIERIKEKVLQKRLLTEAELEAMDDNQIMNIIFWPGFSTGDVVTDISGRGVGLDVVHTKITQLGGSVNVTSNIDKGCKVSIKLPVTMATIKSFLISSNKQIFAIPTSCIKTVQWFNQKDILHKEGRPTIIVDNKTVPVANLAEILEIENKKATPGNQKLVIVVIEAEGVQVGFIIDKLLGEQEILHKNLTPPLIRIRNIAGITTLGSGEVCLILNISDLIKSAFVGFGINKRPILLPKEKIKDTRKKHILVVDDSVTTRILERNILKAAGYEVSVAINGLDALTKIASESFDVIVSDVEMPEINGLELTEKLRHNNKTKNIPIILVTSLAKETDKQKGYMLGANAYIVKGEFNQNELLTTIEKLSNKDE